MKINVCGCALVDHLFLSVSFEDPRLKPYWSRRDGDGGLVPGKLVFAEDLERFAGEPYGGIVRAIFGDRQPDAVNLGGPAIVGAINAAQILYDRNNASFQFFGASGNDGEGRYIVRQTGLTPLDMTHYAVLPGSTPSTDVLSDPSYHDGKGERLFVNRIGAAAEISPESLGDGFFDADTVWFAATALVPRVHDALTSLLRRAKQNGKTTIVSTVFDFRNEKRDPVGPWPLGESADSYRFIDLLIVDRDEALRLAGVKDLDTACAFFRASGVSAFFITRGAKDFLAWSDGRIFRKTDGELAFPVSALADRDLAEHPERRGDTTGCGDNFAGGIVASFVRQKLDGVPDGELCVADAAAWAAASGGAACFCKGGTFIERSPGEKQAILRRYADAYLTDPAVVALMRE